MGLADGRQDQQEELILQRLHPNGVADLLAPVGGEMEREKERGPISQVGRTVSAMLSVVGNASAMQSAVVMGRRVGLTLGQRGKPALCPCSSGW